MTYKVILPKGFGTVDVAAEAITVTLKRPLRKPVKQTIPTRAVNSVNHEPKAMRADVVTVHTSSDTYQWQVTKTDQAEALTADILAAIG